MTVEGQREANRNRERLDVVVHPLGERDLPEADRVYRLAFGTFIGLAEPLNFAGDTAVIRTRWQAAPQATLGAYVDGRLVGSNFVALWGSFGFFGPLTVHPEFWGLGIAQRLLPPTLTLLERSGARQTGLFTFAQSALHVALYQKHGYWPGQLTLVMAGTVNPGSARQKPAVLSDSPPAGRAGLLASARALTDRIFPGLDVSAELVAVLDQALGDVVLLERSGELAGFAVCHAGAGSEAGTGRVYVKFGAVLPGPHAEADFARLLDACEAFAAARGAGTLEVGVNAARREAYRQLRARGFRTVLQGVAMQRPDAPGFNRPGCLVIDDWR